MNVAMFTMLHHHLVDCRVVRVSLTAEQTGSVSRVLYELQEMFNIFIMMPANNFPGPPSEQQKPQALRSRLNFGLVRSGGNTIRSDISLYVGKLC